MRAAEGGRSVVVGHDKLHVARGLPHRALPEMEELRASLARAGVDTLELSTDDDLADAILRFVALRRRRVSPSARAPVGVSA